MLKGMITGAMVGLLSFAPALWATTTTPSSTASVQLAELPPLYPCARMSVARHALRASPFEEAINTHATTYQVEATLIKAVMAIESCYNQSALSPKGAQGLMQLIPDTAERFGISNPYDSSQNIKGGARYLVWLSKRFAGDLTKVLAAYNAGEGRVDQYGGIPPFKETQAYVRNVLAVYHKLSAAPSSPTKPTEATTPLDSLASAQGAPVATAVMKPAVISTLPTIVSNTDSVSRPTRAPAAPRLMQAVLRVPARTPVIAPAPGRTAPQSSPSATKPVGAVASSERSAARIAPPARRPLAPVVVQQAVLRAGSAPTRRVQSVFQSPFQARPSKPGRAGWQANKALAPQLYKQ